MLLYFSAKREMIKKWDILLKNICGWANEFEIEIKKRKRKKKEDS
jgi:hypothetical protein